MAATSFKIRGIEPPDLGQFPPETRKLYWSWVVELGLRVKGKEILAGWDKDGKPLRALKQETKDHRKSAMSPSRKGDPSAPPLIPAWQKSRTYSLLAGRAVSTHAEFYWRYDAWTGQSWGEVLAYQAKQGRNVFGISPGGIATIKVQSWAKWDAWKASSVREIATEAKRKASPVGRSATPSFRRQPGESSVVNQGRKPSPAATYGINADGPRKGHGGRTPAEWDAYFRQTAGASPPGRPASPAAKSPISGPRYNRIIRHTWGQGLRPGSAGTAAPVPPRPQPRITPDIAQAKPVSRLPVPPRPPTRSASEGPRPPALQPKPAPPARDFAQAVLEAVELVPTSQLAWGDRAWSDDVWREYLKLPGVVKLGLDAWKERVVSTVELRGHMVRLDMVQVFDHAKVNASEIEYKIGGRVVATFNFFRVAGGTPNWRPTS